MSMHKLLSVILYQRESSLIPEIFLDEWWDLVLAPKWLKNCHVFLRIGGIEDVILYGSRAKGDYRKGSDIDITIFGDQFDPALLTKIKIDDHALQYKIDLSFFTKIQNLGLWRYIKRIGKILYQKEKNWHLTSSW